MKNKRKRAKGFLRLTMGCLLISSGSIIFLPFLANVIKGAVIEILPGIFFWAGLMAAILFYMLSNLQIRNIKEYQEEKKKNRIGVFAPCSTLEGVIVDILFFPACIISVLGTFFIVIPDWLMVFNMWVTLVTIYGHFVLNGRLYKFLYPSRALYILDRVKFKKILSVSQNTKEGE